MYPQPGGFHFSRGSNFHGTPELLSVVVRIFAAYEYMFEYDGSAGTTFGCCAYNAEGIGTSCEGIIKACSREGIIGYYTLALTGL